MKTSGGRKNRIYAPSRGVLLEKVKDRSLFAKLTPKLGMQLAAPGEGRSDETSTSLVTFFQGID
jgi:hypothetical protein